MLLLWLGWFKINASQNVLSKWWWKKYENGWSEKLKFSSIKISLLKFVALGKLGIGEGEGWRKWY